MLLATLSGNGKIVKLLFTWHEVHANPKNEHGETLILCAVIMGHETIGRMLLERDAIHIPFNNKSGQMPRSWEAMKSHEYDEVVGLQLAWNKLHISQPTLA
jgi:ankyrin repeat protein